MKYMIIPVGATTEHYICKDPWDIYYTIIEKIYGENVREVTEDTHIKADEAKCYFENNYEGTYEDWDFTVTTEFEQDLW